jgi:hypothetical protein
MSTGLIKWGVDGYMIVYFENGRYCGGGGLWDKYDRLEVVGNIHDNPDFTKTMCNGELITCKACGKCWSKRKTPDNPTLLKIEGNTE